MEHADMVHGCVQLFPFVRENEDQLERRDIVDTR
jgi:hypothetical protein